jgi:ferredoxin
MKQGCKFLLHSDLPAWLTELSSARRVVAPRREGNAVVYREYDPEKGLELTRKATESAKHALFPRSEELFSFQRTKPSFAIGAAGKAGEQAGVDADASGIVIGNPADPDPSVVFGLLGCDAGGVSTFDPVYGGDRFPDGYYLKRREATVLIARSCSEALSTCFCHWVGGGPADRRHADVLATDLGGGWLLEPLTWRGGGILGSKLLQEAAEKQDQEAAQLHEAVRGSMGKAPDLSGLDASLLALFENKEFWWRHAAGCIACGTCTYLCPTCHCFTITDETAGRGGVRLRAWDTCMAALYTLEASGHNPRTQKAARLRNRIGHKFAYFPRNNAGRISCCGCGRCIKSCPSSVDIRAIVLAAQSKPAEAEGKAEGTKEAAHG